MHISSAWGVKGLSSKSVLLPLSQNDLMSVVYHFSAAHAGSRPFTIVDGLEAFHDAVSSAFAHVDLEDHEKARVNAFINALQDLYETVREQGADKDVFMVEGEDLADIAVNLDCLRQVICIQHTQLHHHDLSSALLWAKTALRRLINSGWNLHMHYVGQ